MAKTIKEDVFTFISRSIRTRSPRFGPYRVLPFISSVVCYVFKIMHGIVCFLYCLNEYYSTRPCLSNIYSRSQPLRFAFFLSGIWISNPKLSRFLFSQPSNSKSCYSILFQKLYRLLLSLTPIGCELHDSHCLLLRPGRLFFTLCLHVRSDSTGVRDGAPPK
jgi:hypothetical protein